MSTTADSKRRVLVTGASKGIGRAIVRRLREDGYWPIGIARTCPLDLEEGEDFHRCDLADSRATRRLVETLCAQAPLYGVVNNAAVGPVTSIEDCTLDDMHETFQVNVIASLICAQAALPAMKALGTGRIINFSSRAALGKENRTAYSATKAALIGMTRTWALELARHNITVNAIAPGPIDTDGYREGNPPGDPRTQSMLAAVPLRRIGKPEEIAHAVSFLLHEQGGFITGQTLHIDGGFTIAALKLG